MTQQPSIPPRPGPDPRRRRFLLVSNPIAGKDGRRLLEPVLARLAQAGATVERCEAADAAGARARVRAAANAGVHDAVIAAGGDGTLRQAAAGAMGTPLPIGLVPLGTGNVMAHELVLTREPGAIARTLLSGPALPLRGGLANGEPFFLMAGAGFDGRVIAALDHGLKHRIGKLAYCAPVLRALAHPLHPLRIVLDGAPHTATWAIIANAGRYGGAFVLIPDAHVLQPGLHAVLFKARGRATLLAQLIALTAGRLHARADVAILPCRTARIETEPAAPVQIDGDAFAHTPLDVTAATEDVLVIVPESFTHLSAHPSALS